jgi:ArsR family transcriptional regulator
VLELENYFKGLADANRLRILNLLLHGELCVCDIQYVMETSQSNVSRHLTYLKNSGLVLVRREGTRMYYRLAQPNKRLNKPLFAFLREAFLHSDTLVEDSQKLKKAVENGSCTASDWRPYSALVGARTGISANERRRSG